ncbi:MAG: thiamine-binding protein [Bacteroidetes bacterium]|nr:thiamine-binding protein [Bacteroidota bacterium]
MKINAAIQLLPLKTNEDRYSVVDKAIDLINKSGLNYKVCPFETVVEGEPDAVYKLIQQIQIEILKNGCDELILNIKIHAANRDLTFQEKLEKY